MDRTSLTPGRATASGSIFRARRMTWAARTICIASASEGGTPMPVSADRFTNEFQAAPAPDGSTVAFAARGNGDSQWWRHGHSHLDESEIWLRKEGRVASYEKVVDLNGRNAWPMWMPDGKQIYFMSDRSGRAEYLDHEPRRESPRQVTKFTRRARAVAVHQLRREGGRVRARFQDLAARHQERRGVRAADHTGGLGGERPGSRI